MLPFFPACSHFLSNHSSSLLQSLLPILADISTLGLIKPLAEKLLTVQKLPCRLRNQSTDELWEVGVPVLWWNFLSHLRFWEPQLKRYFHLSPATSLPTWWPNLHLPGANMHAALSYSPQQLEHSRRWWGGVHQSHTHPWQMYLWEAQRAQCQLGWL